MGKKKSRAGKKAAQAKPTPPNTTAKAGKQQQKQEQKPAGAEDEQQQCQQQSAVTSCQQQPHKTPQTLSFLPANSAALLQHATTPTVDKLPYLAASQSCSGGRPSEQMLNSGSTYVPASLMTPTTPSSTPTFYKPPCLRDKCPMRAVKVKTRQSCIP